MNIKNIEKWRDALRSGIYKETYVKHYFRYKSRDNVIQYNPFGVLVELYLEEINMDSVWIFNNDNCSYTLTYDKNKTHNDILIIIFRKWFMIAENNIISYISRFYKEYSDITTDFIKFSNELDYLIKGLRHGIK